MSKKALITGITGQDGSYLAELLLEKNYEVHGIIRRSSSFNTGRIMHIFEDVHNPNPKLKLHYGDLTDGSRISKLIEEIEPNEVYNLGAQSHVRISFDEPVYTAQTVGMGALRMLEAIRNVTGGNSNIRFYQASSSEIFGKVKEVPQNEETPFTQEVRMLVQKFMPFIRLLITERLMGCMLLMVFYLITKALEEEKLL